VLRELLFLVPQNFDDMLAVISKNRKIVNLSS
jgi:hypothetical protein